MYRRNDILVSSFGLADDHFYVDNGKPSCPSVAKTNLEFNNSKVEVSSSRSL